MNKQQSQTLKNILKQSDIIKRFTLLNLWIFDVFTSSLTDSESIYEQSISDVLLNMKDEDLNNSDNMFTFIQTLRKSISDTITKLEPLNNDMKRKRDIIIKLNELMGEGVDVKINDTLDETINSLKSKLDKLNNVSMNDIIS